NALEAIIALKTDVANAHDALLVSKVNQAHHPNLYQSKEPSLSVGDHVYLSTAHQRQEYDRPVHNVASTEMAPK
ncbi:hypothetical protein P692DRAFT_201696306, partial [Suillus brevipes Sb2]